MIIMSCFSVLLSISLLLLLFMSYFFFFKQKTAYEMRISDWSSDVCSSDLLDLRARVDERGAVGEAGVAHRHVPAGQPGELHAGSLRVAVPALLPDRKSVV